MFTDEELEKLEEEEYEQTVDEFALLLPLISTLSDDMQKELIRFYQKYGIDGVVTYLQSRKRVSNQDKRKRITVLYLTIDSLFDSTFVDMESEFRSHLTSIAKREIDYWGVEVDIDEVLETSWGTDHLNWYNRLWKHRTKWDVVLSNDLKQEILKGNDLDDVLKNVVKRFKSIESSMWTLLLTESSAVQSITRNEIFKKMGAKKYRYYTKADERTCETCGSMHGLIFPMSAFEIGVTASPMHPRCRCWEVPVFEKGK